MTSSGLWLAPAKINLFLHVLGQRDDGYHRLQTVFQFLDYCDELSFEVRQDGNILRNSGPSDILAENDLVVRAARALQRATGTPLGVAISLAKRIPMGAGLGGGSSDAATALVALNQLWHTGLTPQQLAVLGLSLGADVPVFVHGYAAWAEGVGEVLSPMLLPEPWYAVLVPPVHVATAEIFSAPKLVRNTPAMLMREYQPSCGHNDCTAVTIERYPLVAQALAWLDGFAPAKMSGTGAAVFAAFEDRATAEAAIAGAPQEWCAFVAKGCNQSPIIRAAL